MKNLIKLMLVVLFTACTKEIEAPDYNIDHGGYTPNYKIDVNIISPEESELITHGETIEIKGEITGNFLMHGYSIRLYNKSNNDSLLYVKNRHTHGDLIQFNGNWTNNLAEDQTLELEIFVVGNHEQTADEAKTIQLYAQGNGN